MTTGITTVDSFELAFGQQQQHEAQQVAWMELGYQTLGYQQAPKKENGVLVGYVWVAARPEATAGLPAAIVAAAKQAIAAEQAARAAFAAKDQQASADIARLGLTGAGAEYHRQITRGEAWAAFQARQKPTRLALRDLGQLAERGEALRQTVSSGPRRISVIEQGAAHQVAQIRAEVDSAVLEMMQLGIA